MFPGWDKVTPPVRCYMKLCDCRRAAPPVRRVCIGLFHARKMFRHIKAQSVKSSKLVVKSIWNPANVLVFQGFFGIIKIFRIKKYKKYTQPFVSNAHTYTRDTHSEISLRISRDEQNNGSMHNHRRRCKRRNERRHFCQLRAGKQKMSKLRQTDETDKEQARKIFSGLRRLSRLP